MSSESIVQLSEAVSLLEQSKSSLETIRRSL